MATKFSSMVPESDKYHNWRFIDIRYGNNSRDLQDVSK